MILKKNMKVKLDSNGSPKNQKQREKRNTEKRVAYMAQFHRNPNSVVSSQLAKCHHLCLKLKPNGHRSKIEDWKVWVNSDKSKVPELSSNGACSKHCPTTDPG